MNMQKAVWTSDGNRFAMSMQLTKVDEEKRLVSGWASLDNRDLQGDIVLADASERAFKKFRGNIREMHKNEAVGRMVTWRPETYYDTDGTAYRGIFVTAYVSKGAPLTWEKVLDGTLSAFSIKGPITDWENDVSKGQATRIVKDYELEELSLVDAGGNQYANVVSFEKVNGTIEVKGMVAETEFDNVFWCDEDRVAKISDQDVEQCFDGHAMEKAGWTERDSRSDAEKINSVLAGFLSKGNDQKDDEGGVDMSTKNETAEETTVEPGSPVPAEVDSAAQGEAETEVAASLDEVTDVEKAEEPAAEVQEVDADADLEKSLEELETRISEGVQKNEEAIAELMKSIDEKFEAHSKAIEDKWDTLASKQEELTKNLADLADNLEKMVKSVGTLEAETAMKKSGDLGGSQEGATLEKSGGVWEGTFL